MLGVQSLLVLYLAAFAIAADNDPSQRKGKGRQTEEDVERELEEQRQQLEQAAIAERQETDAAQQRASRREAKAIAIQEYRDAGQTPPPELLRNTPSPDEELREITTPPRGQAPEQESPLTSRNFLQRSQRQAAAKAEEAKRISLAERPKKSQAVQDREKKATKAAKAARDAAQQPTVFTRQALASNTLAQQQAAADKARKLRTAGSALGTPSEWVAEHDGLPKYHTLGKDGPKQPDPATLPELEPEGDPVTRPGPVDELRANRGMTRFRDSQRVDRPPTNGEIVTRTADKYFQWESEANHRGETPPTSVATKADRNVMYTSSNMMNTRRQPVTLPPNGGLAATDAAAVKQGYKDEHAHGHVCAEGLADCDNEEITRQTTQEIKKANQQARTEAEARGEVPPPGQRNFVLGPGRRRQRDENGTMVYTRNRLNSVSGLPRVIIDANGVERPMQNILPLDACDPTDSTRGHGCKHHNEQNGTKQIEPYYKDHNGNLQEYQDMIDRRQLIHHGVDPDARDHKFKRGEEYQAPLAKKEADRRRGAQTPAPGSGPRPPPAYMNPTVSSTKHARSSSATVTEGPIKYQASETSSTRGEDGFRSRGGPRLSGRSGPTSAIPATGRNEPVGTTPLPLSPTGPPAQQPKEPTPDSELSAHSIERRKTEQERGQAPAVGQERSQSEEEQRKAAEEEKKKAKMSKSKQRGDDPEGPKPRGPDRRGGGGGATSGTTTTKTTESRSGRTATSDNTTTTTKASTSKHGRKHDGEMPAPQENTQLGPTPRPQSRSLIPQPVTKTHSAASTPAIAKTQPPLTPPPQSEVQRLTAIPTQPAISLPTSPPPTRPVSPTGKSMLLSSAIPPPESRIPVFKSRIPILKSPTPAPAKVEAPVSAAAPQVAAPAVAAVPKVHEMPKIRIA